MVRPVPRIVGSEECLANGERLDAPLTSDPIGLDRFLPADCYNPLTNSPCERIYRCPDIATIADLYVLPNNALIDAKEFVGAGSVGQLFIPGPDDKFSRSLVVVLGNEAWQWVDGTRNAGQLIAQAYDTRFGGRDWGRYTASSIYQEYATEILSRFTAAGAADCTRWTLVGHSYGGAAASVAAARLKLSYPNRTIALCTFGAPRAGDARLIEILRGVCQTHIRRGDDPIPFLPPQVGDSLLDNLFGLAGLPFWQTWGAYATYEMRRRISEDGWIDEGPDEGPTNSLWTSIISQITAGVVSNYEEHNMYTYWGELHTACHGDG